MMLATLLLLSTGTLGIFVGAQIAEAVLLVPFWKTLSPNDFFELHKVHGKKIYQFFAPLTIAATLLPLVTVGVNIMCKSENQLLFTLMGCSTMLFFSTYFMYFKKANKSFLERSLSDEALPIELTRWGNWHWGRIYFECIAFGCSLLLLSN